MCQARYCLDCEVPFHEDQTCEEYHADSERRTTEEQESLATVRKISKPCPGANCGINIDKIAGCDHVTCESNTPYLSFLPYIGSTADLH